MARDITLSLTIKTSRTSSYSYSFTSTPTPPYPSSFLDHHNLYILPCKHICLAPHPLHVTSCMQHKYAFLFHGSSHISKPIPCTVPNSMSQTLFLRYSYIQCYQPCGDENFVGAEQYSEIITNFISGRMPILTPDIERLY